MVFATVVPPYISYLSGSTYYSGHSSVDVTIVALFWRVDLFELSQASFQVFTFLSVFAGVSFGFFNIIFAFQVIRYIRGDTTRKKTLVAGVLTLISPIIMLLAAWPIMFEYGIFPYIGPIPIQLAIGLLLMRFAGPKEVTTPW